MEKINILTVATNNKNKLREICEIFEPLGIKVQSQGEAGVNVDPDENGKTFHDNSEIKAEAVFNAIAENNSEKTAVIADDSGLCVDALDGGPGVYSARYAPKGEECGKLLDEMKDVPDNKRTARFKCDITLIDTEGNKSHFEGVCEGKIGYEEKGTNGFGYDPVFMVGDRTLAEMSSEEKNAISHRGEALKKLFAFISEK